MFLVWKNLHRPIRILNILLKTGKGRSNLLKTKISVPLLTKERGTKIFICVRAILFKSRKQLQLAKHVILDFVNKGIPTETCIHDLKSKGAYGRLVDKVLKRYQNNILVKLLSVNYGVKKGRKENHCKYKNYST